MEPSFEAIIMQITVIEGSPHLKGASSTIANRFVEGAREAGHTVDVVEVVRLSIGMCRACNACGASGPCIQKDDMADVRSKIMSSDMVVFVTPNYFCGFSAQLKAVIDRFYSFSGNLKTRNTKAVLIAASADREDWTMDAIRIQYDGLCRISTCRTAEGFWPSDVVPRRPPRPPGSWTRRISWASHSEPNPLISRTDSLSKKSLSSPSVRTSYPSRASSRALGSVSEETTTTTLPSGFRCPGAPSSSLGRGPSPSGPPAQRCLGCAPGTSPKTHRPVQ